MSKNVITTINDTHFELNGQVYNKDTYTIRKIKPMYPYSGSRYNHYAIAFQKDYYNIITPYSFMSDYEIDGVVYSDEALFYENLTTALSQGTQGGGVTDAKMDEVITAIENNSEKELIVQISDYAGNTITGIDMDIINSVEVGHYDTVIISGVPTAVFTVDTVVNYQHINNTIVLDTNVTFTNEYVRITGQK
jgi:hypothetical protein